MPAEFLGAAGTLRNAIGIINIVDPKDFWFRVLILKPLRTFDQIAKHAGKRNQRLVAGLGIAAKHQDNVCVQGCPYGFLIIRAQGRFGLPATDHGAQGLVERRKFEIHDLLSLLSLSREIVLKPSPRL